MPQRASGMDAAPLRRGAAPGPYAALDLGTNNCRLLIARPTADGFRVIDAFSRIVRLGEGLSQDRSPKRNGDRAHDRGAGRLSRQRCASTAWRALA